MPVDYTDYIKSFNNRLESQKTAGPKGPNRADLIYRNQTISDLTYGTPAQRLAEAKAKQSAPPPSLRGKDLKSTLTELINFPGVIDKPIDVTPTQIQSTDFFLDRIQSRPVETRAPFGIKPVVNTKDPYIQNLGKSLIVDNLAKSIEDLEAVGVNDDNIEQFNNLYKDVSDYYKKAIDFQNKMFEEIADARSIYSPIYRDLFGDEKDYVTPSITDQPQEFEKFVKENTRDLDKIKPVGASILKKLGEIKAPYLGKKFMEAYQVSPIKVPFKNNAAADFNKVFDPNKSWKDDSFKKEMIAFAFQNASPGEDIYALKEEDIQRLLNGEDLSEAERTTLKSLEDNALNAIGNYLNKELETVTDKQTYEEYETALKNINQRIFDSKKDYDVSSYGKAMRSLAVGGINFSRTVRSMASSAIPFYDYEIDAGSIGNDIRFGPVPVDLDNNGKMDVDKYGNLILSNQFTYIKKDGSLGYNAGAIPELSSAVIGQMAPIIAIDFLTRGGGKVLSRYAASAGALGLAGRAAVNVGKKWEAVNAWNGLRLADRVSTFALVTGGVYGSMYQDELRWTKDTDKASSRAWGRSVIEGLTEAIGAPEIGMFTSPTRFGQSAGRQLLNMFTPRGATISQKLGNFILSGGRVGKLAIGQGITESLEEEMSLYGNYLFGKMIKAEDKDYGREDTFEGMDVAQTFLDSLVAMAPYSLLGVSVQQATSRNKLGPEHETLWNMANDPEYYKAKIKDLVDKKKFTTEQAAQALQVVAEAKGVLDSIPEFKNIKDLRTLLSDHDAQKKYFHDVLYKKKLQAINYDELSDEQKKALKDARIVNLIDKEGTRELRRLSKKKELTEEEQKKKTGLEALKKATLISGYQFTQADKKKLVQLGILKQEKLENSPEDLLAELENVDKEILKNRKRADQFLNMTDEEKEETVAKLFQQQIESIETFDDPSIINTRLAETKSQLEFITKMPPKYKAEYTGRQALIEALETKLGELIAVNPQTGRNKITEEFLADSTEGLTHWQLEQKKEKLETNKQFINETDYAELEAKYGTPIKLNIWAFNQMSAEEQEAFLVGYLTEIKDTLPDPVFELETLESLFTLIDPKTKEVVIQPNISEEMFESVRNKVFEIAAEEKKQEMQPKTEAVEAVEETEGTQEVSDEDSAFSNEEEGLITASKQTDETGKTDTTNVEELFHKLNKTNNKKSTLSKEAFANKLMGKIKKSLEKKGITLDPKFFNELTDFVKKGIAGKYNSAQILSKGKQLLDNAPNGVEELISGIIDQVEFANKFYKVNPNRRSLVTGEPFTSEEVGQEESQEEDKQPEEQATEETTPESKLQQQANAEAEEREKQLRARQNAVIQLQIPSSTYGFEVLRNNTLSKDPAIQRNAEILRFFTKQDYSTHKVRITSRLNFLQQVAEAQGLNFQDFMDLLNKAHEEYSKLKGSRDKKAKEIAPLLKQLNDFFGEDFFEQTFESSADSTRSIPELIYMVEQNGSNLSDPILTIINAEGKIQDFDGYPFYTNIDSNPRILRKEDTKFLPYWQNILGDRVAELEQFAPIAEAVVKLTETIKKNPAHSEDFPISRITQGTHIAATEKLVTLEESGLEVTEENIKVLETPKQKLGEETIAGVPGQVFLIINDSPVVLTNEKVLPEEAKALAAIVFDKELRQKFFGGKTVTEEVENLKAHIAKVFNIHRKQGRKVAFAYDKTTKELIPFIPGVNGKQLNQQELTDLFQRLFYNVSKNELDSTVPRFSMQEGEVVKVADQSYIDFIKSTNKVYMVGDNPGVRRNQRILFDMSEAVEENKSKASPKAKEASQTSQETSQDETEKALEILESKTKPVAKEETSVSDKKAGIERRIVELQKRLDEDKYEKEKEDILNSLTKGFLPTGFRFGSSIGIIEKYISEEDRWISVVDNIRALDKDPIKAIDKYFNQQGLGQKISNANTEYKKQIKPFEEKEEQEDKDITNEQIKLLSTKEGILIRKDWSLGKGLGYTGEGTNGIVEIDEDENGNKFEAEYYLTGENDEWIESSYFLGKTKQEVIDKINAKYDAELDALETPQAGSVGVGGDVGIGIFSNAKVFELNQRPDITDIVMNTDVLFNTNEKGERILEGEGSLQELRDIIKDNPRVKVRLIEVRKDGNTTAITVRAGGEETVYKVDTKAVEQSLKETPTTSTTKTKTVSDKKADIERITDAFEPKDNFKSPVDAWSIVIENSKGELIKPEIIVEIRGNDYTKKELLEIEDPENPAVQETLNEIDRLQKLLDAELAALEEAKPTRTSTTTGKVEFDKLPGKSATPTFTYAGIGSRQTPPEVLAEMTAVAEELSGKFTLNTGITFRGKEEGADAAFSKGAKKKNLFSPENQGSRTREQAIAKEVHPNPNALSSGALKLMARNTNQVFGENLDTPVDFVLFYAKETAGIRPEGGTGQAVEMARLKGIPTINMANPNWRQELDAVLQKINNLTKAPKVEAKADIPQNKVSGIESFGSTVTANAEAIKALGTNPYSIDMIEAGFRTRTTRSETEMGKYGIKVGDVIKHFGKSADGTTKTIFARVTAIHPKGTPGWKGTWNKEGWRAEDVDVIDRFKDGAAAIEFEVIKPTEAAEVKPEAKELSQEEKETFSPLAASITVNQVEQGQKNKIDCGKIGVTKPGKTF